MPSCPDCKKPMKKATQCCDDSAHKCNTTHYELEPYYKCERCGLEVDAEDLE